MCILIFKIHQISQVSLNNFLLFSYGARTASVLFSVTVRCLLLVLLKVFQVMLSYYIYTLFNYPLS